jgi:hypothetical protein
METGGVIYLVACAIIFILIGSPSQGGQRPDLRLKLLSLAARVILSAIAIPLTILLIIERYFIEPIFGVRVIQLRQNR